MYPYEGYSRIDLNHAISCLTSAILPPSTSHIPAVSIHLRPSEYRHQLQQALQVSQKAANQVRADLQFYRGHQYSIGLGVEKSPEKAFEWFQKAADLGHLRAQNILGMRYLEGSGVEKSPEEAFEWFQAAAICGYLDAQHNLGYCYQEGAGVEKSPEKAFEWFYKAAMRGHTQAQNQLGFCYRDGSGVEKSHEMAFFWFQKAANRNAAAAQFSVGKCYLEGIGVEKSLEKAFVWMQKAAHLGLAHAQELLGTMYLFGNGTTHSVPRAIEYLQKAAMSGRVTAQEELARIQGAQLLFTDTMSDSDKILLVKGVWNLSSTERDSIIQTALHVSLPTSTASQKVSFLEAGRTLSRAERDHIIQLMDSSLFTDKIPLDYKPRVFLILAFLSEEKRNSLMPEELKRVLPKLWDQTFSDPLLIFFLLPDSLKTEERLAQFANFQGDRFQEYRADIITALERELFDEHSHPLLLLPFASFIKNHHRTLQLEAEHPLIQRSREILQASVTTAGPKNPFVMYRCLRYLAKQPLTFQPPVCDVAGEQSAFRWEKLLELARAFHVSKEELPVDATRDAWNLLVTELKAKVESNEEVKAQVKNEYEIEWGNLWKGSLSDPYFCRLLTLPNEQATATGIQFLAILHSLLSKSKEARSGSLFSEQEEALIKLGMSIQFCKAGKSEGIALTYRLLDPAFRYQAKGLEGGDDKQIEARQFIADIVYALVNSHLSGTGALMQELTGIAQMSATTHQATYLKNMLGPIFGFQREVEFDLHTGMLTDALVTKKRTEVFNAFFHHMTPQALVTRFVEVVNSNPHTTIGLIRHLIGDSKVEWDYDTDDNVRLNARAALDLLRKEGYLT